MTNYFINSFYAENFRQFSKISVKFNKKFNFITGPNGCGKSSVLTGIHHCLYHDYNSSRLDSNSCFHIEIISNSKKIFLGLGKNSFRGDSAYRKTNIYTWQNPNIDVSNLVENFEITNPGTQGEKIVPLFLGTKRSIDYKQINGTTREEPYQQSQSSYLRRNLQTENSNVKQWFINRYFAIDKEWAVEEKINWHFLLENLPKLAPNGSDFDYVKTGRDLEPIFTLYGQECYLEELSAGFQAIFSVIANIIEWIEKTYPEGSRNIQEASGTVLIDELDLHLHPEWQFNIREGLEALFPNLQFIVTTHSPHLLASAKEGEVIVMTRETGQTEYHFEPINKRYSGWSTDQILEDIMGVKSLKNKDYERLIDEAFDAYETKDKLKLLSVMEQLKRITHSDDTIVQVLEMKMASLELQ
ncbi:hypothetical protein E0H83_12970 [Acinetobacter terrestris]|uniref:AAA family ATPase n=1 Tax=Acinetobacter terrestris TaxID=2529843 RepID=UPI00103E9F12|nr:AAA family ATPase [Acinetobacter terrestris]TCB41756.1 hypothetical protein E0H83_12970 [Acinetobacter terrestris]